MSGESREPPQKKPRLRRDILLGALVLLPVLLAALSLLLWKPVMIRYTVRDLRRLRARGSIVPGTDECVNTLISLRAVRIGMTFEEVVRILGKPDEDFKPDNDKNLILIPEGFPCERWCEWFVHDTGLQTEVYAVTFDAEGHASFVPYISKKGKDASGTRWAHYVRTPLDLWRAAASPER